MCTRKSSQAAFVSPDSQPPARSSCPRLSQALWLWLRSLRRPAVSLGVGACECLCVCLCACLWLVCSLRKVEGLAWGQRGGLGSACVCVCVSPLAVLESVSESSCISASVSPDSQPPARSSCPRLSQALWLWLRSLRRPAVSLGVGACECLCVCLCACLWLVCSLRKVEGLAWGQRGGLGSAKGRG